MKGKEVMGIEFPEEAKYKKLPQCSNKGYHQEQILSKEKNMGLFTKAKFIVTDLWEKYRGKK